MSVQLVDAKITGNFFADLEYNGDETAVHNNLQKLLKSL
jgi:hypothetical protein